MLSSAEADSAMSHFSLLIDYSYSEGIKKSTISITDLLLFSLGKSLNFLNEVSTQLIKQLNSNKKQQITMKLLQYMKVFLYCFTPEDEFLNAMMHFLIVSLYDN